MFLRRIIEKKSKFFVSLDEVCGERIGGLNEAAERGDVSCGIEIGTGVGALEGEFPCGHVPSDGEHFVVGKRKSGEEEDNDGLLAVSYGEMGEIAVEAWDIKPGAVFLFLPFDSWLVDISLANIVQK